MYLRFGIQTISMKDKDGKLWKSKLYAVAASVGVTPEEYLLRFEEVLNTNPKMIFDIFEK